MRRRTLVAITAAAMVLAAAGPAVAAHPKLVKPGQKVQGMTAAEWAVVADQAYLGLPADEVPFIGGSADPCLLVDRVLVFAAAPEATCTVPKGTHLFWPGPAIGCSDVEPDPFFGATPEARRECALTQAETDIVDVTFTVDGEEVPDVGRFLAVTPDHPIELEEGNILTGEPGTANTTVAGYLLLWRNFKPGEYTIVQTAAFLTPEGPLEVQSVLHLVVTR